MDELDDLIEAALRVVEAAKPIGLPSRGYHVEPREFLALALALDEVLPDGLSDTVKARAPEDVAVVVDMFERR